MAKQPWLSKRQRNWLILSSLVVVMTVLYSCQKMTEEEGTPLSRLLFPEDYATSTSEVPVSESDNPPETVSADVDNPTAVGQAVDDLVRPAIADVLGEPTLVRASDNQDALTVNLSYETPNAASEGDGEILRDALISRGATLDPDRVEMDYHADSEQGFVLYDTGDPEHQTVRISITPGKNEVCVNADKAR